MSTLTRVTGKVFGSTAPLSEIGQFGSALAGNPVNTQDVATIQALNAYTQGWGSGVISSRNFPPIEEVTGVLKTISYQACYLLQEGIPTYDANTNYSNTSIVKLISGTELILYVSLVDDNLNNPLTDTTKWARVIFTGTSAIGAPQITLNFNATLPTNCIWLEGQQYLITDYPNLYAIYGTAFNTGDEPEGYASMPDFRERTIYGGSTPGYVISALPDLQLSTTSAGAHTHTRGSMNITGGFNLGGGNYIKIADAWGAFSLNWYENNTDKGGSDPVYGARNADFNANRNWTGETSSNGAHTHTITSSNSIVGQAASNKVWTDGVKVRVYTRYQ